MGRPVGTPLTRTRLRSPTVTAPSLLAGRDRTSPADGAVPPSGGRRIGPGVETGRPGRRPPDDFSSFPAGTGHKSLSPGTSGSLLCVALVSARTPHDSDRYEPRCSHDRHRGPPPPQRPAGSPPVPRADLPRRRLSARGAPAGAAGAAPAGRAVHLGAGRRAGPHPGA